MSSFSSSPPSSPPSLPKVHRAVLRNERAVHLVVRDNPSASEGGATLVLVHGSMGHHAQLDSVASHFSSSPLVSRVVSFDLYGCGQSDKPHGSPRAFSEEEHLRDVVEICRRWSSPSSPLVLVGHSFGTNLAIQIAARGTMGAGVEEHGAPPVAGLVLIGTAPTRPGSPWLFYLPSPVLQAIRVQLGNAFLARAFHPDTPQEVIAASTAHNRSNPWHVTRPFYQQVRWGSAEVLQRSPKAGLPATAVVVGESDRLTTVEQSRAVADAIPGATFHVIAKSSHMVMMEKPAELNAVIDAHLRKVLGVAAGTNTA
jgi:pimeloyl-ACP methyl ester carboxylesterase